LGQRNLKNYLVANGVVSLKEALMQSRRITLQASRDGYHTVTLQSVEQFQELLDQHHFRDRPYFVFRGQRDPSWKLLPGLYRTFHDELRAFSSRPGDLLELKKSWGRRTAKILRTFLLSLRNSNHITSAHQRLADYLDANLNVHMRDVFEKAKSDPEVQDAIFETWALGQHHCLLTPLMDWTESPLAALFFAFQTEDERGRSREFREYRAVYALNPILVRTQCEMPDFEAGKISFINPVMMRNLRLAGQRGLFTYSFDYEPLDQWVVTNFRESRDPVLIRFLIPNKNRDACLRWLNRVGVNPQTLFPDTEGYAKYSNMGFIDPQY
jgi:hypothetical protein